MNDYVILTDENGTSYLAHHGIKGQKWGVRRFQNEDGSFTADGKVRYAKKEYKKSVKDLRKSSGSSFGMGMVRDRAKAQAATEKSEQAYDAYRKARSDRAREKHGEKAEFREHVRQMNKAGLPGSMTDTSSGGRSSRLYDRLTAERGKEYADKVAKTTLNQNVALLVGGVALSVGSAAAQAYLMNKYY